MSYTAEADVITGAVEPAAAERVRTLCAQAETAHLFADGAPPAFSPAHHLFPCGHVALTVDAESALSAIAAGTAVVIELLDPGPAPTGRSARGLVWIHGRMTTLAPAEVRQVLDGMAAANPDPALLDVGHRARLLMCTVDSAVLADANGAEAVDRAALLAARPDPFCHVESLWVRHIHRDHPDMVERLRPHLPRGLRRGRVRLLGLDRYGLRVGVEVPEGRRDVRVPFPRPVDDSAALSRALRYLTACPFSRGLHRRPR